MDRPDNHHPINYVAKQTGLTTHTIRMWERRYGAVEPKRTPSKHRLYSDDDINRLRLLHRATDAGHTISKLANLSTDQLRSMLRDLQASAPIESSNEVTTLNGDCANFIEQAKNYIQDMDREKLEQLLMRGSIELSNQDLLQGFVGPILKWVGDEWHAGSLRISHEHLASTTIRAFLDRYRRTIQRPDNAPRITVTTLAGQKHEMGAMIVSIIAATEGWQDFYFGPDMPAVEIAKAAMVTKSRVVAISAPVPGNEGQLMQEIIDLKEFLPAETTVIAGGAGLELVKNNLAKLNVYYAQDLKSFRNTLAKLSL